MKRSIQGVLIAVALSVFTLDAYAINVSSISTPITSCPGASVSRQYYIPRDTGNLSKFQGDMFWTTDDRVISDLQTDVRIYQAQSNLVSCTNSSDWKRLSTLSPGNSLPVVALGANCTFNKPTNKTKRNVQIVYNIGYFDIVAGSQNWALQYFKNLTEVANNTPTVRQYNNIDFSNFQKHSNECMNIELRYCGDGILDTANGETCDPEDASHTGWGNGGCHPVTCTPVETPTCNGLTMNPLTGIAPVNSVATCSGYKVSTYKIDCGNGQVFNGTGANSGNQTFSHTCNYTSAGTYTPICTINGTITNTSCQKTVTITAPTPAITIDKVDANPLDKDGNVGGNDSQKVNSGDKAVFKIRVTNTGNEALTSLKLTDTVAPNCGGNLTLPTTRPATWLAFTTGGAGNHTNATLEPGEYFEYKCEKANTTANYTNTADVEGTGVTSGKKVTDTDPTQVILDVIVPEPSILIDKVDANPADIDGNIGNDTQTVAAGADAIFKITVTNNGPEALTNLKLTDAVAPNCGGNVTLPNTYPSTWLTFNHTGNADNKLDPGETFTYTCKKPNTTVAYTNTAGVEGTGVTSGKTVTDTDPTQVILAAPTPAITIDKVDANPLDKDGNVGNDTQSVGTGEKAVFKIRVTNTGTEALNTLVLTDAIAPNCGGNVTLPSTYPSTWSGFTTSGAGDHTNAILEVGEYFEYTCEKPNTTTNYTNIAKVCGKGVGTGTNVCDEDPTDVKVGPIYDLALVKKVQGTTTTFAIGAPVTFVITVYNQGEIAADNVIVTDYIPTGLTLTDSSWTASGSLATKNIGAIPVGGFKDVTITFTVNSSASGNVINWAEISSDNGDDVDSTPDQNISNDCHGGKPRTEIDPASDDRTNGRGDVNNNGICEAGEDEDDHDPALITIGGTTGPAITIDKVDANPADLDGSTGNDSQKVYRGNEAVFKIRVTNTGTEALNTLVLTDAIAPNCGGNVTLPSTYPSTWLGFTTSGAGDHTNAILEVGEYFEYTCSHPNTQSDYTNTAGVTGKGVTSGTTVSDDDPTQVVIYTTGGGSSSSSSGGPVCSKISTDVKSGTGSSLDVEVTCYGNTRAKKFRIDCGNGQEIVGDGEFKTGWSGNQFTGTCSYTSAVKDTMHPKCYVGTAGATTINTSSLACGTKITLGGPTICGDGVLQRPNSNGQQEECERGLNADGTLGVFPSFCTSSCQIDIITDPGECRVGPCVITIPNEGVITFGPFGDVVIGDKMNPFAELSQTPYMINESSYDLYFDQLCVKKTAGNTLTGNEVCRTVGEFYPGQEVFLPAYPDFKGNIANIPAGQSYGANTLVTSIKHKGVEYYNAYFAAPLNVRVSRPAVATTGGGTSYVKTTNNIADVTKVADGVEFVNKDENKNFVGTSVADNLSSYTKDNVDTTIKTKVEQEGEKFEDSVDAYTYVNTGIGTVNGLNAVTTTYNGLDNVFILKNGKNLKISSIPAFTDNKNRTYIIEGGDLIIDGNLEYNDNIAFVVKGGNIQVDSSVTKMEGIYIAIPDAGGNYGNILGKGAATNNTLTVYGSLYGKIENLLSKRTYVRNNSSGQISVGTIVSFASSLFRKPAPLVGEFIQEYIASEKIAK